MKYLADKQPLQRFALACVLVLGCFLSWSTAQTDSTALDLSKSPVITRDANDLAAYVLDTIFFSKRVTNPRKATIMSAIIPGSGQVYNGQFYKLPVIYGGIGAMLYVIDFNGNEFNSADRAYRARLASDDVEPRWQNVPTTTIQNRREEARKNRELSYFGLGLIYLLNIADAFVSSHLTEYDIDEDISRIPVKARPRFLTTSMMTGGPLPCAGVTLTF